MNDAETPSVIQTFDEASQLEFDHISGGWTPTRADEYFMFMDTRFEPWRGALDGVGQVTVCPPCSFFDDGRCTWCPGEHDPGYPSDRPECAGCLGTHRPEPPWYRRSEIMVPLVTTIAVTTVATIASAILLRRIGLR